MKTIERRMPLHLVELAVFLLLPTLISFPQNSLFEVFGGHLLGARQIILAIGMVYALSVAIKITRSSAARALFAPWLTFKSLIFFAAVLGAVSTEFVYVSELGENYFHIFALLFYPAMYISIVLSAGHEKALDFFIYSVALVAVSVVFWDFLDLEHGATAFGNRNHTAILLVVSLPLLVFSVRRFSGPISYLFLSATMLVAWYAFSLGSSAVRVAILIQFATFSAAWILFYMHRKEKIKFPVFNFMVGNLPVVLMLGLILLVLTASQLNYSTYALFFGDWFLELTYKGWWDRLTAWGVAYKAFLQAPFLGYGPGSFSVVDAAYANLFPERTIMSDLRYEHAHNQYVELLVESGLFGLFIFIYFFYYIFSRAKSRINQGKDHFNYLVLTAAAVSYLFISIFSVSPEYVAGEMSLIFVYITFLAFDFQEKQQRNINRRPSPVLSVAKHPMFFWGAFASLFFMGLTSLYSLSVEQHKAALSRKILSLQGSSDRHLQYFLKWPVNVSALLNVLHYEVFINNRPDMEDFLSSVNSKAPHIGNVDAAILYSSLINQLSPEEIIRRARILKSWKRYDNFTLHALSQIAALTNNREAFRQISEDLLFHSLSYRARLVGVLDRDSVSVELSQMSGHYFSLEFSYIESIPRVTAHISRDTLALLMEVVSGVAEADVAEEKLDLLANSKSKVKIVGEVPAFGLIDGRDKIADVANGVAVDFIKGYPLVHSRPLSSRFIRSDVEHAMKKGGVVTSN